MKKYAMPLLLALLLGLSASADVWLGRGLSKALADTFYCKLTGCTMSGALAVNSITGVSRLTGTNTLAPTAAVTGFGTTPSLNFGTGTGDAAGTLTVTAGTAPSASGTVVLTFSAGSAYGATSTVPICQLGGTAVVWNARATCHVIASSGTAVTFQWDNNAVALTNGVGYRIHYWIVGR